MLAAERLKSFGKRMTSIQDLARGIPESRFTEVVAAQRKVDQCLLDGSPELKQASKERAAVLDVARRELEQLRGAGAALPITWPNPYVKQIMDKLAHLVQEPGDGQPTMPFDRGVADPAWNTLSPISWGVNWGIVGWSDQMEKPPVMSNVGAGEGQIVNGNLDLYWKFTIPRSGAWIFDPDNVGQLCLFSGSHKVVGRGNMFTGIDARAEAHFWSILYLDNEWLAENHKVVSCDETRSENRSTPFQEWIQIPGGISFQAQEGQELGLIVRFYGYTWANNDGTAELAVDLFGIIANTLEDLTYQLVD